MHFEEDKLQIKWIKYCYCVGDTFNECKTVITINDDGDISSKITENTYDFRNNKRNSEIKQIKHFKIDQSHVNDLANRLLKFVGNAKELMQCPPGNNSSSDVQMNFYGGFNIKADGYLSDGNDYIDSLVKEFLDAFNISI